jgi:hypothetical protein
LFICSKFFKMSKLKFILSGGGTGGHIYPAIAIANELKKRFPEAEFLFVGALADWARGDRGWLPPSSVRCAAGKSGAGHTPLPAISHQ